MKYIDKIWKMKWKKRQSGKLALVLVLALVMAPFMDASASRTNDATNKKNDAQQALDSTNNKISKIEKEQDELQKEIDALDAELVEVIMNLSILEEDISNAQDNLEVIQADLEQAQIDEANQYEAMKKRIRFMYERGDTAFLVSILESKSITDLLNRVEYVNEVYDYDRQLLVEYQTTKLQVAELKTEVENEIAGMEELQANYKEEQSRYETMIAKKQSQMENFDSQLASAKRLAARYQATIDEQNEIIRQEEERRRLEEELRRQEEESKNQGNNSSDADNGTDPGYSTDISGSDVVKFACQFVGKPYVYGGTDINKGIDCSAFVQYVYRHFGISLPRTSAEQRYVGKKVSYANAQPGDIICYSGHVAIYMGNGQIVHASNPAPYPAGGIKISYPANYRTIITVRRVL